MNLKVNYYGMLAEHTNCNQEVIDFPQGSTLARLRQNIVQKYPSLEKISFTVAVNQEISNSDRTIDQVVEIAFLPPFAGG